ncbi:BREX system P-loop protein BrxC [Coprococcus catus]|uniref:BREX system P-loop protein BrxC n=1 Tax=Coprococcus catus TaxID=116085 RepID=UPI001C01E5A2|nr:BREX system P-loop protein BrxC [Coprococcus catus]MBT9769198.1 BREX system P-loop protein BrxC [Coprococcus catus]
MQIKDMFEKKIDRDIKGVIKVGQSDEENVYQELDEYVVTKELLKHFRDFFDNYEKGINGSTDKMGVWISGFFGSGKSHFLKILSYLLKNSVVEGKKAIEYFTDGKKIDDPMLIAKMTNSGTISSDVMLFNIDSKGSAKVGSGKEAIVEVFMKVFNEMQGYCGSIPYLAEFERQLDNEGRFEEFKEKFEEIAGAPWEKKRQAFAVIQDKIVKTIVAMDFMSEEAARNWCKNAKGSYDLSIEKFVSLVKEYCEKKGPNHHVIFLVDEIGQYIADDTQLMLNLQTIVEDLGTACRGKAWVIVTSQEDIDSITKTKGNDFSKIQGRFDTRLSLSASNVDEVIRKRILEKNEISESALKLLYEQKESIIKNLITFTADTADKKLYTDKTDFADCYPFIPYQFNLLGQVLTAVRTHGASGKHLSDQSRSMLALFQESAVRLKDSQEGVLVPFSYFYDPLHKFIDHQHSQVITDAEDNSRLDEFDVELLKVLFMIKYVKEIKANVDNLTTLMISNIDDDRIELRKKIEESLKKLIHETLVQKNGEIYIFLTNEEQEINNAIKNESVEMGEIIGEASTVIFEEILPEKKYRYSSRYLFPFNQKVDDRYYKNNQSNDIGLTIITPYGEEYSDSALRMLSSQGHAVIVKLPNDSTFLDEITESIKIYKFLNKNASGDKGSFDSIRRAKEDERIEKKERIRIFIEDALKHADIYVNGDKAVIAAKEPVNRISEALGKLVSMQYNKLTYMETAPEVSDIMGIFDDNGGQLTFLGTSDTTPNKLALEDVIQVIGLNNARRMMTSLKALQDKFGAAPYGFDPKDVQWLVAMLFKMGRVSLTYSSQNLSLLSNKKEELVRYLTKREFAEKLLIDIRERATDGQIRSAKEVMKDYFGFTLSSDDDDTIMKSFKNKAQDKLKLFDDLMIEYRINPKLPCKPVIEQAKKNLEDILTIKEPAEFFKIVDKNRDDLLDDADDTAPVFDFFKSGQKKIFERALEQIQILENSKVYVRDQEIIDNVAQMEAIVKAKKPFGKIQNLPDMSMKFVQQYGTLLEKEADAMRPIVDDDLKKVLSVLDSKTFAEVFRDRMIQAFEELQQKLETSQEIAAVKNIRLESDTVKLRCLDEITEYEEAHQPKPDLEPPTVPATPKMGKDGETPIKPVTPPVQPKLKKRKNISISNVAGARTYSIENEQDIDKFLAEMKQKLLQELEENTIIILS